MKKIVTRRPECLNPEILHEVSLRNITKFESAVKAGDRPYFSPSGRNRQLAQPAIQGSPVKKVQQATK